MVAPELSTTAPPLTPARIEKLTPGEYRDGGAPGLRLRVTPQGTRVFRWSVTRDSRQRWITIGRWSKGSRPGHVTLAEARLHLENLRKAHVEGKLDAALAELRPKPQPPPVPDGTLTVRKVTADFLAHLDRERRRPEQAHRIFDRDILPTLGDRPISTITSMDVRALIERIVARGSPVMAGHTLALVRQYFDFAVDRGDIDTSPAARFRKPKSLGARKADVSRRFLAPEEIIAFWKALDAYKGMTPPVKGALRLLLLLGVRSGELLRAEWSQVDFDKATLTVPPDHQKVTREKERTARPWVVPLPPSALAILRELKALADSVGSRFVLASFHPASEGGAVTEKALNHAMRRLFEGKAPALKLDGERPTPHDLRRTVRTHLEETLGVPENIAERCLNHSRGVMVNTYSHGDLLAQRRDALKTWDTYVVRLVAGKGAGVVRLGHAAVRP